MQTNRFDFAKEGKELGSRGRGGMLNSHAKDFEPPGEHFPKGKRNLGKKGVINRFLQTIFEYFPVDLSLDGKNAGLGSRQERVG